MKKLFTFFTEVTHMLNEVTFGGQKSAPNSNIDFFLYFRSKKISKAAKAVNKPLKTIFKAPVPNTEVDKPEEFT